MKADFPKKGRLNQIYVQEDKMKLNRLICPWCGQILIEPQRLFCGHTVCLKCIEDEVLYSKSKSGVMKCIICGSLIEQEQIGEDRIGKLAVQQIKVRCSSKNCKWQGKNRDFQQHFQHDCLHNQRTCDSRYEYTYYSNQAKFVRKLNDDEQIRQQKPNMLHSGIMPSLREKLQKQHQIQQNYNDQEWKRKTKRFRHTFGL